MSLPFRDLLGLDENGETTNPALTPEQRAAKARALQGIGVTPTPKPAAPASTSDGQGFWDQLKAGAVQNTQRALNFVNNKPQQPDVPEPTTLAGKAGRFVAGIADPVNLITFGPTAKAIDALGVPGMIERQASKLAGESLASKLAAKTAAVSGEGAVIGGIGNPISDYAHSVEEGKPYDPSTIPSSVGSGMLAGAILDPLARGALEVPGLAKAGFDNMIAQHRSEAYHHVPEDATWETHDPWANNPAPSNPLQPGQANSGLAGAYEPGKLFIKGALKKFGDRMDVGAPVDDSGRKGVAVDLYRSGTKDDPTLSVGFLRHNEDAPQVQLKGRTDDVQPEPTVRQTMGVLQHIKQLLVDDPKIKWLDTQPTNSSVMQFLAKYGGRWEDGGARMVVPADNIRNGIRAEQPDMVQSIHDYTTPGASMGHNPLDEFHPDPFGRLERAIRKGHDPEAKFYSPMWEGRDDVASGANPRDPDTGLLAYSGVPGPEIAREGKAFGKGIKDKLSDVLDAEHGAPEPPDRPVINVDKLPIEMEAKKRLADTAEQLRSLKDSERTSVSDHVEQAQALAQELRKHINGNETLDVEKARRLSGVELRARTEVSIQLNKEIQETADKLEAAKSPEESKQLTDHLDHLRDVQHVVLKESIVGEGEAGRTLRDLRYAPDNLTSWLKKGQKAAGDGRIPEAVDTEIRKLVAKRKEAKDPKSQADIDERLESLVEGLKNRPLWAHVNDIFKTLITSPGPTDLGIVGSNIVSSLAEQSNRAAATLFDQIYSLFTNERTMSYQGLAGIPTGAKTAAENVKENFRSGKVALANTQLGKPVGEHYGLMQKVLSKVPGEHLELAKKAVKADAITKVYLKFHWARLGAEHMAFRDILTAQNLVGEAHVKAINEGLKGDARDARVVEILKDPGQYPSMVARAIADARRATFVKDNQFSAMINAAKSAAPRGVRQALDLAMPFTKIAANIAEAGIDYTPVVGLLKELTSKSKDQHSIVLALGKQATAGGLMAAGFMLYKQGRLTGAGPTSTAEKQQWENEGKAPYSMKVGSTWRSYERVLGPVGWPVGLGADLGEFHDNLSKQGPHQTLFDKANTVVGGYSEHLADEVPGGALSAFTSYKTANPGENFLENTALQVVAPNIMGSANLAKGLDNKERATDTFLDKIKARIPVLRQTLPAKIDATGREIPTADNLLGTMVDPTHPHVARQDPALEELDRLGINLAKPGTTGTYTGVEQAARFQAGLTPNHIPEKYDRTPGEVRAISQGTIGGQTILGHLNSVIANPSYQAIPDEIKRAMLNDVIGKFRAANATTYELGHPHPLTGPPTWP